MVKVRLAAVIVIGTLFGGLASWTTGLWPGDEPRATVDHCYITYDRQDTRHSRCVGNWTRGGRGYAGPINGFAVSTSWSTLSDTPNAAYEWEVAVPESQRQPRVFADDRQAWVPSLQALRWAGVPAAAATLLVALTWSLISVGRARNQVAESLRRCRLGSRRRTT